MRLGFVKMTIDKSWTSIKNRLSKEYLDGVKTFISRAKAYVNEEGKVRCPCRKCLNRYWQNLRVIRNHLIDKGFQQSYRTWYYHGESLEPHRDKEKRVASSNKKSKRGSSRSMILEKAIEDNKGNPLLVQFDIADDNDPDQRKSATYKPIGRNGKLFNNHLAQVVRQVIDHSVLSWKKVSPAEKEIVMNQIREKFVFESSDLINDAIDQTMSNNWRDSRYRWHVHFREIGGEDDPQMAKTKRPHTLCRQDIWERLCDHWATEEAKKKGKSNSVNRKKRAFESCHGSSSFTAHRYRMMHKETKEMPKPIEHFKDMHYSQSTGWINDVAQQRYEEMLQRRTSLSIQENGSDSGNITEGDIVNDVLGTRSSYRKSWGSIPRMKAGKRPRQKKSAFTSSGDASHSTPVVEALHGDASHSTPVVEALHGDASYSTSVVEALRGDASHSTPVVEALRGDASHLNTVVEALREQVMGQEQIIQGLIAALATAGFDVPTPSSHQHRLQPTLRFLHHHIHRHLHLHQ